MNSSSAGVPSSVTRLASRNAGPTSPGSSTRFDQPPSALAISAYSPPHVARAVFLMGERHVLGLHRHGGVFEHHRADGEVLAHGGLEIEPRHAERRIAHEVHAELVRRGRVSLPWRGRGRCRAGGISPSRDRTSACRTDTWAASRILGSPNRGWRWPLRAGCSASIPRSTR